MKTRISALIAIVSVTLMMLCGCKTSENNYRAAYETAKQAQYTGVDSTISNKMRQESIPIAVVANGDSIRLKTLYVTATKSNDGETHQIMHFGIVVGQFKQVFNARAMLTRLHAIGYTDAYIVEDREPQYYVIAIGSDDINNANAELKRIATDKNLTLREPLPWILQTAARH